MKKYTYAAIDIGSNAIRLLINNIYENADATIFNKINLIRIPIRLGEDVFTHQMISEQSKLKLAMAMQSYNLLMRLHQVEKYEAFATSAMRESQNAQEVIDYVKQESDIAIKVITGEDEAHIIFNSELKKFSQMDGYYLYIDVGGGSTEISLLHKGQVLNSQSFPIGTVRLLNGHIHSNYLTETVKPWVKEITKGLSVEAIGSGGNINYMFKKSEKKEGRSLSKTYIHQQYKLLSALSYEERIERFNMKPDRADVIVPALLIYDSIMKYANTKRIYAPKIGVADGMIHVMYEKEKNKALNE